MRVDGRDDPSVLVHYRCFNRDTGAEIYAIYADDETGEYGVYRTNEQGQPVINRATGELVVEHYVGSIKLVDDRLAS